MKIRKIRFKNINSLRGEHEIDFTSQPLSESQLFAITGPTGSGKSTILDVIALALYKEVPRLDRVTRTSIEESGAILTRNTEEAYASVEYECEQGVFCSTWSISTNRNGKLRDYEMELTDLISGKNRALRKSDIPAKNGDLIGLNYDQFIKSILLAQGEFAKFLKVRKSERGELLEKITGTGIYRQLGKKAHQKRKQFAEALDRLKAKESTYKEQLLSESDLETNKVVSVEFEKEIETKKLDLSKSTQQLDLRKELQKLQDTIGVQQVKLQTATDNLSSFKEKEGEKIRLHEATFTFVDQLDEWASNEQKIKDTLIKKEQFEADLRLANQKKDQLREEISSVIHKQSSEIDVLAEINAFQAQVELLDTKFNDLNNQHKEKAIEYRLYTDKIEFKPPLDGINKDAEVLEAMKIEASVKLEELTNKLDGIDLNDIEAANEELEEKLEEFRSGYQWKDRIHEINFNLTVEQANLELQINQETQIPKEIETLKSKRDHADLLLKNAQLQLDKQKLLATLEEHRNHLKDGEPCPLCGATEHPWSTDLPSENSELENQIIEFDKDAKILDKQIAALSQNLEIAKHENVRLTELVKKFRNEQSDLQEKLDTICLKWQISKPVDWEDLIVSTVDQKNELKLYQVFSQRLEILAHCEPLLGEMLLIFEEADEFKKKKNELYEGSNIAKVCEELRSSWTSISSEIARLTSALTKNGEELYSIQKSQDKLKGVLIPLILKAGFEGMEDAISKRLKDGDYHGIKNQMNELLQLVNKEDVTLNTLINQLETKKEGVSEESTESLEIKKEQLTDLLKEKQKEWEEVKRKLTNHSEMLEQIASLQKEIAQEEEIGLKWQLLHQLIGDANGTRFNEFAQDLTLQRLLLLANVRLAQLIDRYQIASPEKDEDDSLVAIDNHMGGQRRSVKTLSGGETFIMSLSLALALSDLAAKNVQINSLFIDEGFGTLDPETLDQTLDTLEKLQTESSKTIGIISHVDSLKERIGTQIQLDRNGQGYSSLKVVRS